MGVGTAYEGVTQIELNLLKTSPYQVQSLINFLLFGAN